MAKMRGQPQVALLRAVNLGRSGKISMDELRALAVSLKLDEVRTLINTGNLIYRSGEAPSKIEAKLEAGCLKSLGLDTPVLARTAAEWSAILEGNPFPEMAETDPSHLVVMPLKAAPEAGGLERLRAAIVGRETVELRGSTLYACYPDNIGESKLTSALIERKLGVTGTARNWNTARKIEAALLQLAAL